jgi:hypothetical protein
MAVVTALAMQNATSCPQLKTAFLYKVSVRVHHEGIWGVEVLLHAHLTLALEGSVVNFLPWRVYMRAYCCRYRRKGGGGAVWAREVVLTFRRREKYLNPMANRTTILSRPSSNLSIIPIVLIRLRPAFVRTANEVDYFTTFRCRICV